MHVFRAILFLFIIFIQCHAEGHEDFTYAPIIPHPENRKDKRKSEIAISMVFQAEAPYLKEWIEYHRLIGVGHFYLYNNLSTDEYLEVLEPYIKKGIVELFEYPEPDFRQTTQTYVYNHSLKMAKSSNDWLAIIDADEFIVPVETDNLSKVLKQYKYAGGVVVFWQTYGTSGVPRIGPGELMVEKLVKKYSADWYGNKWNKSIIQPKYVERVQNPHWCVYKHGSLVVTPDHKKFRSDYIHPQNKYSHFPIEELRINHYWFRTQDYFDHVKLPRQEARKIAPKPHQIPLIMEESNREEDRIMDRFVPKLKAAMMKDEG